MTDSDLYGSTGVGGRFDIYNDPRRIYPVKIVGPMTDVSTPPDKKGNAGSVAIPVGGLYPGLVNVYLTKEAGFGIGKKVLAEGTSGMSLLLGNGAYDAVLDPDTLYPPYSTILELDFPDVTIERFLNVNGELAFRQTSSTQYGGATVQFPGFAGSVAATASNVAIVGTGTSWASQTLTSLYAYTPSHTKIRPGDLIEIVQGAIHYFHRIVTITDDTHMTIFPAWQGTTASSLAYSIHRSGYNSRSSMVKIYNSTNKKYYVYYAGNSASVSADQDAGTIMCWSISTTNPDGVFMCPQTSAPLDVNAADVAYYKGYLLYGFGGAVGWSVAGFPTTFPFGATDFPAQNVTVVNNADFFVSFEWLGDQLIALFHESAWLVQATGSIPEFNFYRLPEATGAMHLGQFSGQLPGTSTILYTRPSCTARNAIFYTSKEGLSMLKGGTSICVSRDVNSAALDGSTIYPGRWPCAVTWEPWSDSVIWHDGDNRGLMYDVQRGMWSVLRIYPVMAAGGTIRGITGNINSSHDVTNLSLGIGFWDSATGHIYWLDKTVGGPTANLASTSVMSWNSPIINLSEIYDGFQFGGFTVDGQGAIDWSIFSGKTPNISNMTLRQSGTGTSIPLQARKRLGQKIDDPFIMFNINTLTSGLKARIDQINIFPAQVPPSK